MTIGEIKKTTREKVVRALRTCSSDKGDCEECPYNETSEEPIGCLNLLVSDAADLIENQAQAIEALAQANAAKRDELEKRRWIPVAEALPKAFVSVLGHVPEEAPRYLANCARCGREMREGDAGGRCARAAW